MNNKTYSGMPDDFENNINSRMQDFRVNPGPQIWERVAAALPPEKKKRRFAIWWWLLPLAACLGGGIWLAMNGQKNNANTINKEVVHKVPVEQNNSKQTVALTPADTVDHSIMQKPAIKQTEPIIKKSSTKKQSVEFKESETVKNNSITKRKVVAKPVNKFLQNESELSGADNVLLMRHHRKRDGETDEVANVLINAMGHIKSSYKVVNKDSAFLNIEPVLPVIDLINIPAPAMAANTDTDLAKKTDAFFESSAEKKSIDKKVNINKSEWSVTFAAGRSNLNGGIRNNEKALLSNFNSALSGPGLGAAQNSLSFKDPNAAVSFSAGVIKRQTISKHWNWQAEINYQLLTSKQSIGSKNDSLLSSNFFADAYSRSTIPSSATRVYTNQVHRLQIATGMNYILNPFAASPISFYAGVSSAYNLLNNILLHDYRSGSYIRAASFSNKLMFGGTTGFDVFLNKKIHAGILFQHDFTNVGKPAIGSSYHWNGVQLSIGIPLSKHK